MVYYWKWNNNEKSIINIRTKVPVSEPVLVACNTGPEIRSTGVRFLESSSVSDAPD